MQIDIQSRSYQLTGSLLEHVVQRVRDLLADARDHVSNVRIRLFDVNATGGGQDRRCVVQVKLDRLPMVVAEETQVDIRLAVDRALDRAGRTVKRRLERPRERRRGAPRNLAQVRPMNPTIPTPYPRSIH